MNKQLNTINTVRDLLTRQVTSQIDETCDSCHHYGCTVSQSVVEHRCSAKDFRDCRKMMEVVRLAIAPTPSVLTSISRLFSRAFPWRGQ